MSKPQTLTVHAEWDDEAGVWVASSDDIPGLVTEAETRIALIGRLAVITPEMLELNAPDLLVDDLSNVQVHFCGRDEDTVPLKRTGIDGL